MWNHEITRMDDAYQLSFVTSYDKRKSYAASFGFESLNIRYTKHYRDLLSNFSNINVREQSAVSIAKRLTNKEVNLTLDPTFLLTKDEWLKQTSKRLHNSKYIFTYQITVSSKLIKFAKKIKSKLEIESISIPFPLGGVMKSRFDLQAGPAEWLSYIAYSELVITDSFHGVSLCIILNKPFKVILSGAPTRIVSILNMFGLEEHIIHHKDQTLGAITYNWDKVNALIKKHRNISILHLIKTLNTRN